MEGVLNDSRAVEQLSSEIVQTDLTDSYRAPILSIVAGQKGREMSYGILSDTPAEARQRLDALAEIECVISKPHGEGLPKKFKGVYPCMAVVGQVAVSAQERWAHTRWSAGFHDPHAVHCGEPAVVNVGYNACAEHAAADHAVNLVRQIERSELVAQRFGR